MNSNNKRATEFEQTTVKHLASFDAMTAQQIKMLNYPQDSRSATVGTQRLLKRMRMQGLVSRAVGGDGRYRYFLTETGCAYAEDAFEATFSAGYDRSYLNAASYDIVIETALIEARKVANGLVFGKGVIRGSSLRNEHGQIDAIVVMEVERGVVPIQYIVKVSNVANSTLDRLRLLKAKYKDKLKVVGHPQIVSFALKKTANTIN